MFSLFFVAWLSHHHRARAASALLPGTVYIQLRQNEMFLIALTLKYVNAVWSSAVLFLPTLCKDAVTVFYDSTTALSAPFRLGLK